MDWKEIAADVGQAAPLVGSLLGGPAGKGLGLLIAHALGTDNSPEAVQAAIASDPQAALKLRELELNNAAQLQQLAVTQEQNRLAAATAALQTDAADRDSARKRETSVRGATPAALAWLIVGASVAVGAAVVAGWVTKDPAQATLVGTVIGYVFSESKQVLAYYFGSSAGSDRKTELLAKAPDSSAS